MKKCVYPPCGKVLSSRKQRFCSENHRSKFKATKRSLAMVLPPMIPCTVCGADFQPKTRSSVYCGRLDCKNTGRLRRLDVYKEKLMDEKRLNRERMAKKRQLTNFGSTTRHVRPIDQMMSDQYIPATTIVDVTTTDLGQSSERAAIQAFLDGGGKIKKVGYVQDTVISMWEESTEYESSYEDYMEATAPYTELHLE